MNRAERRRAARQVAKGEIGIMEKPKSRLMPAAIKDSDGKVYTDVESYLSAMETKTAKHCGDVAAELLYNSEIYICAANIIIMLYAMKMTVGSLKTVQKSMNRIVGNYNRASDYVDKIGIRAAYEELARDFGVQLEFDDCDMNWLWDEGESVQKRFRMRVGDGK